MNHTIDIFVPQTLLPFYNFTIFQDGNEKLGLIVQSSTNLYIYHPIIYYPIII